MMFIKNLAYEASAGSGKTFTLVVRYLTLLFMGASAQKILTLTFTNKAADEMNERIIATLTDLESRSELDAICEITEQSKAQILALRPAVLERFLNADTKIMTIDKFFTTIAKKFSLYMGLMPNFTTLASQHSQKLLNRFLDDIEDNGQDDELVKIAILMDKRVTDIFSLLHELYAKKTEVQRLSFVPNRSYHEYAQKAFTAFLQIQAAVHNCKDASNRVISAVDAGTFMELLGKSWVSRDTLEYATFKKCYQPLMDEWLQDMQKNILYYMRAKEQNFFASLLSLLDTFIQSKMALAKEMQEVSFDDIAVFVYDLLQNRVDSEFLYFRLDSKIEHILLDEFQDTSVLQYEILRPLIREIVSGEGSHDNGSFFFVGDVKQSIYRFRGGVSELFEYVCHDSGVEKQELTTNYRSQKKIVEFVNDTFRGKIANYLDQMVQEDANGGYVEILQDEDVLSAVVTTVQKLLEHNADLNEIALLCVTNDDGLVLESVLKSRGISVVTQTTTKLLNQTVIKAIIEYLKYQYFKQDIYRYNFFAILEREVESIEYKELQKSTFLEMVEDVVTRYRLFNGETHLLRFMNILGNYKDIEEFLFEYTRDDTSAAISELSGVRVLTVHKSKGLEFEHLIVVDRLKKPPVARNAIIYEYEHIHLKNLYLRTKGRDELDIPYAAVLDKEKELVQKDTLNALYVAFTRAKRNLFIIKKEQASIFEPLELQVGQHGVFYVQSQEDEFIKAVESEFRYQPLYYGTQMNILSQGKESDKDFKAINFGLALHYHLEMMQAFVPQYIPEAYSAMLNRYGSLLDEDELLDIQSRIMRLLQHQDFLSLSTGVCHKEKPMLVEGELRYMDLLVEKEDGSFCIIDYKSSASVSSQHMRQVIGYMEAVQAITAQKVEGYLCYIRQDEIEIIAVEL